MANPMENQDRFLYAIEITEDNNTFSIIEETGSASDSITVPVGTYYAFRDPDDLLSYNALYTVIEDALNASSDLNNTYQFKAIDLAGSIVKGRGLRLEAVTGTSEFRFSGTTVPNEIFGYESGSMDSQPFSEGLVKDGPYSYAYAWSPYSKLGETVDKRSYAKNSMNLSDEDMRRAYSLRIRTGAQRGWSIRYVPSNSVFADRADDARFDNSQYVSGDRNNSFDTFWASWSTSSGTLGLQKILVVHDDGDLDLLVGEHSYEVLIPVESSHLSDIQKVITGLNLNGELYDLMFDMWVIEGNYNF